jgi:hypothetical protein
MTYSNMIASKKHSLKDATELLKVQIDALKKIVEGITLKGDKAGLRFRVEQLEMILAKLEDVQRPSVPPEIQKLKNEIGEMITRLAEIYRDHGHNVDADLVMSIKLRSITEFAEQLNDDGFDHVTPGQFGEFVSSQILG